MLTFRLATFIFLTASMAMSAFSQTPAPSPQPTPQVAQTNISPEVGRGVELIRRGEMRAATDALRAVTRNNQNDADAWHYLGIALNRQNETREARRSFERALRLRPDFAAARVGLAYTFLVGNNLREAERESRRALELDSRNVEAHYVLGVVYLRRNNPADAVREAEAAIAINNNFAAPFLLKSQALVSMIGQTLSAIADGDSPTEEERERIRSINQPRYSDAAASLERYLSLVPNATDVVVLRERLEALRFYAGLGDRTNTERTIFRVNEVRVRYRLTGRPAAEYTDAARAVGITGTVRLRAVFSADGRVRHILPIKTLSHGLTEAAIDAARRIRFEPSMINGRPVSTFVILEYRFSLR
jgi:TonB family protein